MKKTKEKVKVQSLKFSLREICKYFNKSSQAFYKSELSKNKLKFQEEIIVKLVLDYKRELPNTGGRKLFVDLLDDFKKLGFKIGRDKFFAILRKNNLLMKKKRKQSKTTNSNHWYKKYKNLIKDLEITKANQVFVSDITYIRVNDHFLFLSLITDYYSRKIVGYCLNNNLTVQGPLNALKMALKNVKEPKELIHHSDRGIQYCCKEYTGILISKGIQISMTEENHVYENAVAERVNGILKNELSLGETFLSNEIAHKAVKQAIRLYNEKRLHMSLNYKRPAEVYSQAA